MSRGDSPSMPNEMDEAGAGSSQSSSPEFHAQSDANIRNFAPVARIMKTALPENAKIAKEAKECMQECVSEFISFITSEGTFFCIDPGDVGLQSPVLVDWPPFLHRHPTSFSVFVANRSIHSRIASEKCQQEKRKTVNGEDILFAMTSLGFENYAEALKIYLTKYREVSPSSYYLPAETRLSTRCIDPPVPKRTDPCNPEENLSTLTRPIPSNIPQTQSTRGDNQGQGAPPGSSYGAGSASTSGASGAQQTGGNNNPSGSLPAYQAQADPASSSTLMPGQLENQDGNGGAYAGVYPPGAVDNGAGEEGY